jgi:two-component system, OmpR family, phosphate regulon response regulator PhoB
MYALRRKRSGRTAVKPSGQKTRPSRPLVLVVEDHDDTRLLFRCFMEHSGLAVIEASDGEQAINLAKDAVPDLILMDSNLPRIDGLMATRTIRRIASLRSVPIVIVSGHGQPEFRTEAIATGVNDLLVKPIELSQLGRVVDYQLHGRREHAC